MPGQHLDVNLLAEELNMSHTPIREALRLLQSSGLVDYTPHRGARVAQPSAEAYGGIFALRTVLEPLAVEFSGPHLAKSGMEELERLHTAVLRSSKSKDRTQFSQLNAAWHWHLYDSAQNVHLSAFIRQLWDAYPWRAVADIPGRAQLSIVEHDRVMDALRENDTAEASRQMKLHIESSITALRVSQDSTVERLDVGTAAATKETVALRRHA